MTIEEFVKEYRQVVTTALGTGEAERFWNSLDAVIERAKAEARREALLEAIKVADPYTNHYTRVGEAIDSLPRWDGRTPFKVKR